MVILFKKELMEENSKGKQARKADLVCNTKVLRQSAKVCQTQNNGMRDAESLHKYNTPLRY